MSKTKREHPRLEMVDVTLVETLRANNQKLNADPHGADFNHRWKQLVSRCQKVVEHRYSIGVMAILTLYALYSDDIRIVLTSTQEADDGFEAAITFTFFMFFIEVLLTCISKPGYFLWPHTFARMEDEPLSESIRRRLEIGSFYFWLDVIATGTLLLEMPWITGDVNNAGGTAQQAGSAARVAARAGRVVRLTRMLKYIKIDTYFIDCCFVHIHKLFLGVDSPQGIEPQQVTDVDEGESEKDKRRRKRREEREKALEERSKQEEQENNSKKAASEYSEIEDGGVYKADEESKEEPGSSKNKEDDYKNKETPDDISNNGDDDEYEHQPESVVGATMTDLTNKRVITLVLLMLICIPLLSSDAPDTSTDVMSSAIHMAAYAGYAETNPTELVVSNIESVININSAEYYDPNIAKEKVKAPIISAVFSPAVEYLSQSSGTLSYFSEYSNASYNDAFRRTAEKLVVEETFNGFTTTVTYDNRYVYHTTALQSLYTTTFVIMLLVLGTYFFSSEVNRLVIDPIETMVALVTKIQENPLGVDYNKELGEKDGFFEGMETTTLLNTINKIGGLMRVGFGEAGASVIAENLRGGGTEGGLNLMSGGRMIHSIFGFCDVRQFTDTTECLQEEVMLFVNRIAHILHSIVVQCSGSANKNIGDAFLLTWKLEDDMSNERMASLADQALMMFCKALVELSSYQDFICNFTAAANERLYKRFPGYLVRIGSGLHVGWAIEGAIGSNRKIDASYLSPHVNFTEFLESSTKAYGVPLLISEPFYGLLSPYSSKYVRKVDRIRKPGEDAISLYTYDSDLSLDWAQMKRHAERKKERSGQREEHDDNHKKESSYNRGGRRQSMHAMHAKLKATQDEEKAEEEQRLLEEGREEEKSHEVAPTIIIPKYKPNVWERDAELIKLRHMVYNKAEFRPLWDTGIDAYLNGDWPTAEHIFKETLAMSKEKCGPSKFLLNVIKEGGGFAPPSWPGYRRED